MTVRQLTKALAAGVASLSVAGVAMAAPAAHDPSAQNHGSRLAAPDARGTTAVTATSAPLPPGHGLLTDLLMSSTYWTAVATNVSTATGHGIVSVRLTTAPRDTWVLVEKTEGRDLGRPVTIRAHDTTAKVVARDVEPGTEFVILVRANRPTGPDGYVVKGTYRF
jgi:hypothetical protein